MAVLLNAFNHSIWYIIRRRRKSSLRMSLHSRYHKLLLTQAQQLHRLSCILR